MNPNFQNNDDELLKHQPDVVIVVDYHYFHCFVEFQKEQIVFETDCNHHYNSLFLDDGSKRHHHHDINVFTTTVLCSVLCTVTVLTNLDEPHGLT